MSTSFTSKSKAAAVALCRELAGRGLTHERFWVKGTPLRLNTFRTYTRKPTTARPFATFRVIYLDATAGERLAHPAKPARPKCPALSVACANAHVGCQRPRAYLDGYCKRCHDRHAYRTDPVLRERKIRQSMERVTRIRAAARAEEGK
jgi:hypothetical protein